MTQRIYNLAMLAEKLINKKLLWRCWRSVLHGKTDDVKKISCGIDGVTLADFEKNEDANIEKLFQSLASNCFSFSAVRCLPKSKGSGKKKRILSVPTTADRIVHKAILSILNGYFYPHINTGVSYCGIKKNFWKTSINKFDSEHRLNIQKAIKRLIKCIEEKKFWIVESDIEGFFDNIPKEKMCGKIQKVLGQDSSLSKFIEQIVYYEIGNSEELLKKGIELTSSDIGLSQGSSLSPIFANLYLVEFDNHMKKKFGLNFIRYVDDFIIVCKNEREALEAKGFVEGLLLSEGLRMKPEKTKILDLFRKDAFVTFLGLKISPESILPKKALTERKVWLADKVLNKNNYKDKYKNGKKITKMEQINDRILGWARFYRFYHVHSFYEELDKVILNLKSKRGLDGVLNFQSVSIKPIISLKKWQNLFAKVLIDEGDL